MLTHHIEAGDEIIVDTSWDSLSRIREPIYREIVLEFFSTFHFDERRRGHDQDGVITFRLGGNNYSFSLIDLAVHLGLYSDEDVEGVHGDALRAYLRHCPREPPPDFDPQAAWHLFGPGGFSAGRTLESTIFEPTYRLIHRFIACTVAPRRESQEKMSLRSLWILHQFYPGHRRPDLPWLLALALRDVTTIRGTSPILLGFIVTTLARVLGVLSRRTLRRLTLVTPSMRWIDLAHLRNMKVAHYIQGTHTTVWGDERPNRAGPGEPGVHHQGGAPPAGAAPQEADHHVDEEQPPAQGDAPGVDEPQYAMPQLPSWEHVLLDRIDAMERASERRYRQLSYDISRVQYDVYWTRQGLSRVAGQIRPAIEMPAYHPPPPLDPLDPHAVPYGYTTWDEWDRREFL